MSSSNCCFLTYLEVSQETVKVVWYSHLFFRIFQFVVTHRVKDFCVVNKEELDFFFFFLELPCLLHDPTNIGNLISGLSFFSKPSLYIWKFSVHIWLQPSLKDFEHNLTGMWNENNHTVLRTFFGIALSLGLKWKPTFSSVMVITEFSEFFDILSAAH